MPRRASCRARSRPRAAVAGLVAADQIYAGEQVTTLRFAPLAEQGIVGQLKGNQRAIQVPGDQNQLLAGTLSADDRVDVVASVKYRVRDVNGGTAGGTSHATASRIVLRDLRVLQAPKRSDERQHAREQRLVQRDSRRSRTARRRSSSA